MTQIVIFFGSLAAFLGAAGLVGFFKKHYLSRKYPEDFQHSSWSVGWKVLILGLGMIALVWGDFFLKRYIQQRIPWGKSQTLTSFLDLIHTWNHGISYGLFSQQGYGKILGILALILVGFLMIGYFKAKSKMASIGLIFVMAGALGNAIERLSYGAVFDFIYFHFGSWDFPAFNLADMLITMGFLMSMGDHVPFRRASAS